MNTSRIMSECTLNWFSDRGFELDLDACDDDVSLRLAAVPVPADGMDELRAGPVELDRLEILFKAQVDVSGEPGQLIDAQVQLQGSNKLVFTAKVEDVETAEVLDFKCTCAVELTSGIPASGGPRPIVSTEDDLDWEDEITLEKMLVNSPESTGAGAFSDEETGDKGLQALLRALVELDDDPSAQPGDDPLALRDEDAGVKDAEPGPPIDIVALMTPPRTDSEDQQFSEEESALGLLKIIMSQDGLELEEDHELSELASGVARILANPSNPEAQAASLANWFLDQPSVADLFLGDDELAKLLEQW
ncbi:MAG: hypothetical protein GWP91_17300 [Rhodobacterales bacterium]|nr:hypothetical protein [Rhodobacterales bacterium]